MVIPSIENVLSSLESFVMPSKKMKYSKSCCYNPEVSPTKYMSAEEPALSQPLTASEVTNDDVAAVNFWSSSSVVLAYSSDNGDVSEIDLT